MKKSISVSWVKNMKFETIVDGRKLVLDAAEEVGGLNEGYRPKTLMMVALAGCTGMDVVSVLSKMRVELLHFNLRIEAELNDEHPKKYNSMHVIYEFKGNDLDYSKLERAVQLSVDKFCGVYANYRDALQMSYEIKIER